MFKEQAQTSFDPKRYAKAAEVLQGSLSLANLTLPVEVLEEPFDLRYQLRFGIDSEEYVYIHGVIEAAPQLQCQRCLQPMVYPITAEFQLSPVQREEDAGALPERYEAVLMNNEGISLQRIVEDEFILNLPIAPTHSEACGVENSIPNAPGSRGQAAG